MRVISLTLLFIPLAIPLEVNDLLYVILSQPNVYHALKSEGLRKNVTAQASELGQGSLDVYLLHERWPESGSWTVLPLMPSIFNSYGEKKAVLFIEEDTSLDLQKLLTALETYDLDQELFLGHPLQDRTPTIIHHFASAADGEAAFLYPDFAAGFILSLTLVKRLATVLGAKRIRTDFNIDAKHELAMFIWDEGRGTRMNEAAFLCTSASSTSCATHFHGQFPDCGEPIPDDSLFVAVKTCKKFHKERVPVVMGTWRKDVGSDHIEFYSDEADRDIPTIDLGVPNTERGHCGKLMAILHHFSSHPVIKHHDWLVIVDDDTLISLPRLRRLLACYLPHEPVALGERYGYSQLHQHGYDYITGGGGMVLSQMAVRLLIDSGVCHCPGDDAPDDMTLGMCLKHLAIPITHSPLFHQARPDDYAAEYLSHQIPVSFHKHWMVNPYEVYAQWLKSEESSVAKDEL